MASAGVTPTEIFKSLSKQEIYSEVKIESAWIYRDVSLLGFDILTAIKKNIARTPSQKFKEFLQGMVVTVTSGGSLRTYFMNKADQYLWELWLKAMSLLPLLVFYYCL
jgi:flagellar protein FlaJ